MMFNDEGLKIWNCFCSSKPPISMIFDVGDQRMVISRLEGVECETREDRTSPFNIYGRHDNELAEHWFGHLRSRQIIVGLFLTCGTRSPGSPHMESIPKHTGTEINEVFACCCKSWNRYPQDHVGERRVCAIERSPPVALLTLRYRNSRGFHLVSS